MQRFISHDKKLQQFYIYLCEYAIYQGWSSFVFVNLLFILKMCRNRFFTDEF